MEIYQTEEQQVDAIKDFWKENGSYVVAGLLLGFAGFIGFNYYKDNQLAQEVEASNGYQAVLEIADKDSQAFAVAGEKYIAENGNTSYAALTALALAKDAASHKDWAKTATHLATAIKSAPSEGIKAIASVRLARVQIQLGETDKALKTVAANLPESFNAAIEEIKGDAYLKQGKSDLARNAYQAAIDAGGLTASPDLQMKLDNLAKTVNLTVG